MSNPSNLPMCLLASNVMLLPVAWLVSEEQDDFLREICGKLCRDGRMKTSKATALWRLSRQMDNGQRRKLIQNIIKKQGAV